MISTGFYGIIANAMKRTIRLTISFLLCLAMLSPLTALAESAEETVRGEIIEAEEPGPGGDGSAEPAESFGILEPEALQKLVEDYCAKRGLKAENMSIGYCYTPTGDTWYYNGDNWYYSASMYKVPLMMNMAERYREGEITDETKISGLTLAEANKHVLVYSNNDYAHAMMHYFGTDAECRELYKQYSELPEDYYVSDFLDYSYFTAHFMTDVMKTLFYEEERFPNVIDSLKKAQVGHYLYTTLSEYEIAQKYGSYQEQGTGIIYNHITGIVYTPNPYIITVMTKNMGQGEDILADVAKLYGDYTLELDERLPAYQERLEKLKSTAPEAEEPGPAEEPSPEEAASPAEAASPEEENGAMEEGPAGPWEDASEQLPEETVPAETPAPAVSHRKAQNRSDQYLAALVLALALAGVVLVFLFTAPQRREERAWAREQRRRRKQRSREQ